MKYCVRYAFIDFPEEDPEEENFSRRSILEYVDEEMEADSLAFSHPPFFKVFNVLKQRSMDFKSAYARFEAEVDADIEVKRKDFQDALILEGGSMNAIRKKETAFKKQMESEKEERMRQFASDFSADFLINHEDNDVREVANRLVAERHVLSAIYSRNGVKPETEEDKLGDIVPRALTELRSEILQSRVREIQQKVAAAIESNDTEQQSLLMKELYQLFHIRKKLAENLGDRTISPKK